MAVKRFHEAVADSCLQNNGDCRKLYRSVECRPRCGEGVLEITGKELKNILFHHRKWLDGEDGGVCANLSHADLSGADLRAPTCRRRSLPARISRGPHSWEGQPLRGSTFPEPIFPMQIFPAPTFIRATTLLCQTSPAPI